MDFLNEENVEEMKVGLFNNKSYYGKKSSVLKSGICKYVRRKMYKKFEWCIIEMCLFGLKSKGLMTNLVNRLKILVYEEISFDEVDNICRMIDLLDEIDNFESKDIVNRVKILLEFCVIVKKCKRNRFVSYLNNWWKRRVYKYNFDLINDEILKNVKKYKKKGDSDELLKLGELLIFELNLKERSNRIFDLFNKMVKIEDKCGLRYRRRDGIYLFWEIIEDMFCNKNEKFKKIFEFSLNRFFKKNMNERLSFGIWICMYVWKYDELNWDNDEVIERLNINEEDVKKYMIKRVNMEINDDFVINDFHVNKKFGLDKFGKVGSLVIDEDYGIIDNEIGEEMRNYYVKCKVDSVKNKKDKKVKDKKVKKKKEKNCLDELEFIDFNKFKIIKVIEEGVCGGKTCCIIVEKENKKYILKEFKSSMNWGRDYELVDSLKSEFGLIKLNVKRFKSNKGLGRINKKKISLKGNWCFEDKESVFCIMDYFDNIGDLGKNKSLLKMKNIKRDMLKIRLYDGLFRSSDNILRNILVGYCGNRIDLISIDENDIYGKRKLVFNKSDWCLKKENKDIDLVKEILKEFDLENKIELVESKMIELGFKDKVEEMKNRFISYNEIIVNEF